MATIRDRLGLADQFHQAGRNDDAEELCRGVLRDAPDNPQALHMLGVLAYQTGRHDRAIALIQQAIAAHGPHPAFSSILAAVYLEQGRLADAEAACREGLRLDPASADAHANLGVALMRQGKDAEAAAAFGAALRLQPLNVDARCNLAAIFQRQGELQRAVALLEETLRFAPGEAQVHNDLGGALLAMNRAAEAVAYFEAALRLKPAFAEARSNLGLALRTLARFSDAIACFEEVIRTQPDHIAAHDNLAHTLAQQGKIEAALAQFHTALRIAPPSSQLLAGLSALAWQGHYELTADEAQRIEAALQGGAMPMDERAQLEFAVARVRDKAGECDEAFAHYQRGNELQKDHVRRRGAAFDPAAHHAFIDRLIAAFSPQFFARVATFGSASELPIFVVGMPRSGTTLVEQILASHPAVFGAGELRDLVEMTALLPQRLGVATSYPECLARLDANTARALAEEHLERLQQRGVAAQRVVDKLPFHFLHLGLIATLFPHAKIVHCRRDPLDTCLSCFIQDFSWHMAFALDLAHLGSYFREYERLMSHWSRVLPMPVFDLSYEELTAEQETVSRRLLAYCGLPWHDRCLRFYETDRPVRTASALQVRKPMYRNAVGRWKQYEKHLAPLLATLGG